MSAVANAACDHHAAEQPGGGGGRDGQLQCRGQWHAVVELPVELQRDEQYYYWRDQCNAYSEQCAIYQRGQLCGAGDQCVWFGSQFQCSTDSKCSTALHTSAFGFGELGARGEHC